MITDKDIQKLKQTFSTKDDLKSLENKIVGFKDEILKEIENLRTDSTIDTNIHDQVEDHENRLEKVEKHLRLIPQE